MADIKGKEHSGHRNRMRKKFHENGFDAFEPHEALEMCLFYAIPRKNTNPLAHQLLDRYLNIAGVCDAPFDELMKEFNLSEAAATYLKMLPEFARLYLESKEADGQEIDFEKLGDNFRNKFIGRTSEAVALMLGDAKGKMLYFNIVAKGSINSSDMPIRKIADLALRHNAKTAFVAHNHPSGSALPSRGDLTTTKKLREVLQGLGVDLIDHYIVTTDDYISIRESCFGSMFYVNDDE